MRETGQLLETILSNAVESSAARGGAIHLVGDDDKLERVRTLGEDADADEVLADCFPRECVSADGSLVGEVVEARRTRTRVLDEGMLVATPLLTRTGELVGVLSVLLPHGDVPDARERDPRLGFMEALSASAAVAIETRNFIAQQKRLLESFIELIAAAIDAKSPYTGGHCQRVPELTKMLAAAAERAEDGPFSDFTLSDDEREALHIGAWLHDCGKITTPEHIVDKRTKLECIYDRIHEVRMRFEVLKRDAHIRSLEARLAGAEPAPTQAALEAQWRALDDAFAFVAACNLGGETMDEAQLKRLDEIAQWTWTRTLDDRLGVSWEELQRRGNDAPARLPVEEPLLVDAEWHKVPRPQSEQFAPDNPWGFAMDVPPLKHNQGERYNLSIARGTLTREDRYIINHHMIQTLIMLSKLPFPRHLANVPEIAGGHHERMDGTGYPRRLRREDMSVLARAMAIADVFEALTANDRPYKRPNTLCEAISIMAGMVRDQHLDPDLFRLFVVSGVYREYGLRFLPPEQIDEVDVSRVLGEAGLSS
jgi:HD-GYP domain-containing protein (c-di-GMP phosphodiesterase class II)